MHSPYMAMSTMKRQTMLWLPGTRPSPRHQERRGRHLLPASAALTLPSGGLMAMSHCITLSPPR